MLSCTFSMFWTTVTSQTSSEKSGRTDIQSNRLLCLAQERDSQKGRTRFRVFTICGLVATVAADLAAAMLRRPASGGCGVCSRDWIASIIPCSVPRPCGYSAGLATLDLTANGPCVLPRAVACGCESAPKISLISVCEMSTVCSLSQCSHAARPIQLKSAGRVSASDPASQKQA